MTGIGSVISSAAATAAAPTLAVLPPAADPVSIETTASALAQAEAFYAIQAQAASVHAQIAAALAGGSVAYTESEAANAAQAL